MASFSDLRLIEPLLRALRARSYTTPTPIQQKAIPPLLDGRDLLGIAQTGTGKTAAFALPMLQMLSARGQRPAPQQPRALVLSPTRELAAQIADSFESYGSQLKLRHTVIFGGVGQNPQVQALRAGVDVLVATPGRLLDLMQQRHVSLRAVEIFVLDEADRMLDMGFLPDVERIIRQLPERRHSMLFSATMPPHISNLARSLLVDPVRVEVTPQATTAEKVSQFVYFVQKADKPQLLATVLQEPAIERALVFTRTKHGADKVVKFLKKEGEPALAIHGNKSQSQREKALEGFRNGHTRVLIATDIAARGIDVPGITHVINFDLPNIPESYVHRIGRTARAGREGISLSFCSPDEREFLRDIEKLIRQRVPPIENHPFRTSRPQAPRLPPGRPPSRSQWQAERHKVAPSAQPEPAPFGVIEGPQTDAHRAPRPQPAGQPHRGHQGGHSHQGQERRPAHGHRPGGGRGGHGGHGGHGGKPRRGKSHGRPHGNRSHSGQAQGRG